MYLCNHKQMKSRFRAIYVDWQILKRQNRDQKKYLSDLVDSNLPLTSHAYFIG